MSTAHLSPNDIRRAGLAALMRDLGPAGMIRFLQQFETGSGDYTKDRDTWLDGQEIDEIVARIRRRETEADRDASL